MNPITTISSALIYAFMFIFLYACINPHGRGLIRLRRLSQDLKNAASMLDNDDAFCADLALQIRRGSNSLVDTLFSTRILSEQMKQYCISIYHMNLDSHDKCRTDIDEYINYDLLHQQGCVDLCEHTASGFTALGLLGTFLGMALGLVHLGEGNAQEIIVGIGGLLDGMRMAFVTSIVGIILSLFLGTALRTTLAEAESSLELFLTYFRSRVMRNQSEAALNEIIEHIVSIETGLNTANEIQVTTLDRTVSAFLKKLNKDMSLQIGFLQAALQDMSKQQHAHNQSIQKLTEQMNQMAGSLQNVSNSFLPIMAQSNNLSQQISSASQALKTSVEEIQAMLAADTDALAKHQQIIAELTATSTSLQNMAADIRQQSVNTAQHYKSIAAANQEALAEYTKQFAQTSNAFVDELNAHSADSLKQMQQYTGMLLRNMPQVGFSADRVDALLKQNKTLIDQQAQMLKIMEKSLPILARLRIRREKK